ncbi:uncharacterized protein LOC130451456 [Diorhabda sublineata]|uniref:uncharacterized protein LOC130451456 n=1 Tax=Diorhabda sublineata TaxID=1163346 RepID=UPI0024E172A2|nr:uncharacterized protein LOC130451456 [Diorhabda sublineata]
MEVYRRSSGLLLLLGLSLLATTLQGVQGEVESEGPSESECRPYIEKALKELEAGEATVISSAEEGDGDSKEDIPTVEITTDDSTHQEGEGENDDTNDDESKENDQIVSEKIEPEVRPTVIQKIASFFQKVFQRTPSKKEGAANDSKKSEDKPEDSSGEQTIQSDETNSKELDTDGDSKEAELQQDVSKEDDANNEILETETENIGDDSTEGEDKNEEIALDDEESNEQPDLENKDEDDNKEDVEQLQTEEKQIENEQNDDSKEQVDQDSDKSEERGDSLEEHIEAEIQQQDSKENEQTQEDEDQKYSTEGPSQSAEDNVQSEENKVQIAEEKSETKNDTMEHNNENEEEYSQDLRDDSKEVEEDDSQEDKKVESTEVPENDSKENEKERSKEDEKVDSKEDEDVSKEIQGDQATTTENPKEEDEKDVGGGDDSTEGTQDRSKRSTDEVDSKEDQSTEESTKPDENENDLKEDESDSKENIDDESKEKPEAQSEEQVKEDKYVREEVKDDRKEDKVKLTVAADDDDNDEEKSAGDEKESNKQKSVSEETEDNRSEESTDGGPVEDLSFDTEIPTDLRSRDHVEQLLKVDDDSSESEKIINKVSDITLRDLKKLYENAIKPLEVLYKYRDLSNRHFGDSEIFSKPLILFMGPWSGGKSSIINYLTNNEFNDTAIRTGAEPSPAYFNILMYGEEAEIIEGTELAADFTFSGLQKFGQGLEERLRGIRLPSKLLEKVNIVEIPGILEVRKQVSRLFPFNDACQWFIDRGDIIFLVYDPSKLDVGPETEAILDQLKGREHQTRIILNKADQVKPEELMRVQGALIWNISPLMSSPQPPIMYTTSLWSRPYEPWAPVRLLQAQERAFLRDLRGAIDKRIENKIASARRFAVRVRNHAKMVDCYLTTYYNHKSVFGNRKQVADAIIEHPQDYHIYEGLSTLTNISRYDLPDPDVYKDFFKLNPLYEFQQLSSTCTYFRGCPINRLDIAIAYDLPELLGTHRKRVETALAEAASGTQQQTSTPGS